MSNKYCLHEVLLSITSLLRRWTKVRKPVKKGPERYEVEK